MNCIAPAARTRLTEATPGLGDIIKAPDDAGAFDIWDPANISPLVAYLATADCPFTGETFFVQGGQVRKFQSWKMGEGVERDDRWTVAGLQSELSKLADLPPSSANSHSLQGLTPARPSAMLRIRLLIWRFA